MGSKQNNAPEISIRLTLNPSTYSFANPDAPTLSLTLVSNASGPITLGIHHDSPLNLERAMNYGAFTMTDLTTSPPTPLKVTDMTGRVNMRPPPLDLVCLLPSQPVTRTCCFTRGNKPEFRPEPWHIVRRGRLLDKDGNELNIRRPSTVAGADGLEAGKTYQVGVATEKLVRIKWWWGTKEQVESHLASPEAENLEDNFPMALRWIVENGGTEICVEE